MLSLDSEGLTCICVNKRKWKLTLMPEALLQSKGWCGATIWHKCWLPSQALVSLWSNGIKRLPRSLVGVWCPVMWCYDDVIVCTHTMNQTSALQQNRRQKGMDGFWGMYGRLWKWPKEQCMWWSRSVDVFLMDCSPLARRTNFNILLVIPQIMLKVLGFKH